MQSTTRAGDSDAFFEVELNRAFDRIAEQFATKPKWLLDFEAETLRQSWDHKYSQLTTDTAYTAKHVQALQVVLAIA